MHTGHPSPASPTLSLSGSRSQAGPVSPRQKNVTSVIVDEQAKRAALFQEEYSLFKDIVFLKRGQAGPRQPMCP